MVEKHVCPGPRIVARRWDGEWQFGEEHPFTGRELAIDPLPAEAVSRVRLRVDPFDPDPKVKSECSTWSASTRILASRRWRRLGWLLLRRLHVHEEQEV